MLLGPFDLLKLGLVEASPALTLTDILSIVANFDFILPIVVTLNVSPLVQISRTLCIFS